jgi:hypothetical protein
MHGSCPDFDIIGLYDSAALSAPEGLQFKEKFLKRQSCQRHRSRRRFVECLGRRIHNGHDPILTPDTPVENPARNTVHPLERFRLTLLP